MKKLFLLLIVGAAFVATPKPQPKENPLPYCPPFCDDNNPSGYR